MLLMIDNYDSFTYNLVHYFGELGQEVVVHRNDKIGIDDIRRIGPDFIVISPGPCTPKEAGISVSVVEEFAGKIPILGVCLGHQAIGYAFGAEIIRARNLLHGKTSNIYHTGEGIFRGIPNPFEATRYHSLLVDRETLSLDFEITAWTDQDEIMGIRRSDMVLEGIQFHPESVLTRHGKRILENFINMVSERSLKVKQEK